MTRLEGPSRPLRGRGFGVTQPVLLSDVEVRSGLNPSWAHIDEAMEAGVRAAVDSHFPMPPTPPLEGPPDLDLVRRALHWAGVLQEAGELPLLVPGRVAFSGKREGARLVRCATPYFRANAARMALSWSVEALAALASASEPEGAAGGLPEALRRKAAELVAAWRDQSPGGKNTNPFLQAAVEQGIPWEPLWGGMMVFGQGSRARRMESSLLGDEPALSVSIARDKAATAWALRRAGLPTAEQRRVAKAEEAVQACRDWGDRVVVKPSGTERGKAVSAGLVSEAEIQAAFERARSQGQAVIVERHLPWRDYRLQVLHGRVIGAIERIPAGVVGDGARTISDLVVAVNADPRRGEARNAPLKCLELDDAALAVLARHGWDPDAVPPEGAFVRLREEANVSTGGEPVAVTERVHPDNRRLAERAAGVVGLNLAGVDLLLPDIEASWLEAGGVIGEVNAKPQLGLVTGRHLYGEILTALVEGDGRIPLVLVVGSEKARAVAGELQRRWQRPDFRVGLASSEGFWLGEERCMAGGASVFEVGRALVANPEAEGGILAAEPEAVPADGLPFSRCAVMVLAEGASLETLQHTAALAWPQVTGGAVVNRDDPVCRRIGRGLSSGRVLPADGSPGSLADAVLGLLGGSEP